MSAGILKAYMTSPHKRVARAVGFALCSGETTAFDALSAILSHRLAPEERVKLAWASLLAVEPDHRDAILEHFASEEGAGPPQAPLLSALDQATHWTAWASAEEIEAYAFAAFQTMPAHRQAAFIHFHTGQAVAA
ncbi:MAG: hypothetical protein ACU0DW_13725 [Shimia sp.]